LRPDSIGYISGVIFQIVPSDDGKPCDNKFIVEMGNDLCLIEGFSTNTLADGMRVRLTTPVRIVGNWRYSTTAGSFKTILRAEKMQIIGN